MSVAPVRRRVWYRRTGPVAALAVAAVVVTLGVWALVSPRPSAYLIRMVFERGGRSTATEMMRHAPTEGITQKIGIAYGGKGRHPSMDVFTPADGAGPLPTVVWIHGGAWISGSKQDVAPYLRILAARGFAAVGLDYSIAPAARYPTPVAQVATALAFLDQHATDLRVDLDRLVIAGDSAGAQIASQVATMVTNPDYAREVGVDPVIRPDQLRGVVLNCGVYDLRSMSALTGVVGWGFHTALWAYTGARAWATTPAGTQMSTIDDVTAAFPPTFISGGDGDGLTATQSVPMADRLRALGVDVTPLFWEGQQPPLPHEYQFHLDDKAAQHALDETVGFLDRVTAEVPAPR